MDPNAQRGNSHSGPSRARGSYLPYSNQQQYFYPYVGDYGPYPGPERGTPLPIHQGFVSSTPSIRQQSSYPTSMNRLSSYSSSYQAPYSRSSSGDPFLSADSSVPQYDGDRRADNAGFAQYSRWGEELVRLPSAASSASHPAADEVWSDGEIMKTNVYVRGLPMGFTDEDLVRLAQMSVVRSTMIRYCLLIGFFFHGELRYGKIVSSKAIIDYNSSNCKGFGFIMFEAEEEATACLEGLTAGGYNVSYAKVRKHYRPSFKG